MRPRPASCEISPKGDTSTSLLEGSKSLSCPPTARRALGCSVAPAAFPEAPDAASSFTVADGVGFTFAGMRCITSSSAGAHTQHASSANDATTNIVECIFKRPNLVCLSDETVLLQC